MKEYIGVKQIKAEPMTRGAFAKYKYHKDVNEGLPEDPGYLVEYESGYQSWSPADMFEKAYIQTSSMNDISDGYHTFGELYEFRLQFNASLFNMLYATGSGVKVIKSKKHYDGEDCFGGGWFIVMAELPTGQISNHYELKDWDLFNIPEAPVGNEFDGHSANDVVIRLKEFNLSFDNKPINK